MVLYLDMVGKIHTTAAGNSEINVPLVQMNALLGLISDIISQSITEWPLDAETARRAGMSSWLLPTGSATEEEIRHAAPDRMLKELRDCLDHLPPLFS